MRGLGTTESVSTKLQGISDQSLRFTALAHRLTPESLKASLRKLNQHARAGIDGQTIVEHWKAADTKIQRGSEVRYVNNVP